MNCHVSCLLWILFCLIWNEMYEFISEFNWDQIHQDTLDQYQIWENTLQAFSGLTRRRWFCEFLLKWRVYIIRYFLTFHTANVYKAKGKTMTFLYAAFGRILKIQLNRRYFVLEVDPQNSLRTVSNRISCFLGIHSQSWEQFWTIIGIHQSPLPEIWMVETGQICSNPKYSEKWAKLVSLWLVCPLEHSIANQKMNISSDAVYDVHSGWVKIPCCSSY